MRQALSPTQLATCWESYLSSMGSKRHIAYNDNTEDSKNTDAESQIGGENKRSSGWLSAVKKYLGVGKEARPGAVARHQEISTQSSSSVCWAHKTWIYLKRILYQLSNSPMQIVVELLLASLFGMVIGFAVSVRRKELLRGIHIDPLEALSSSHTYWALSLTSTAISVFVATVGSFMGADEFSKEERASGLEYQKVQHSFSAYFAAKTVVSIFKVALSSLHLASFFLFIGRQPISLSDEYSIVALQMLSAHYIASALGILWRSTADRWSHYPFTLNVFSAITPGLKPIFGNAARGNTSTYLSTNFNTWAAEAFFSRYARVYSHVYKFGSSSVFGYNTHRFPQDIMVAAAMALATRILSFAVLKFIHEKVNRLHASR